jgi:DNA-binding HxlR family transcriptional regulator
VQKVHVQRKEVKLMRHTHQRRSDCPINFALEMFGDPWSLLIIRDIVYFGKNTYGQFLTSEEGIATNILASRLALLEQKGILAKHVSDTDKRKETYTLTEKGLDLIPILVEIANWSALHDPHTAAPPAWIALMQVEKEKMIQLIRQTVQSGGSVFVGENSLLSQFLPCQSQETTSENDSNLQAAAVSETDR